MSWKKKTDRPQHPEWTDEEDQLLLKLLAEGISREEVADRLGRTETAVYRRWSSLGSVRRKAEREARIAAMVRHVPQPTDLTAVLMGDPSPERSALGRPLMPGEQAHHRREGRFRDAGIIPASAKNFELRLDERGAR